MPFASEAQRRWMWANHPDMARRWTDEEKRHGKTKPHRRDSDKPRKK